MKTVVIATIRPWNIRRARRWRPPDGWAVKLITTPEEFTAKALRRLRPEVIFFPHWSHIIPAEIFNRWECIVFHMTDLPYGRGGSPLQNLIASGVRNTQVCALRVEEGLDTGPVYMRRPLYIGDGSAADIFNAASRLCFSMIREILAGQPSPVPQVGAVVQFRRRRPEESRIHPSLHGRHLYDFIRMLDAPEYPPAFLEVDGRRIEFRDAKMGHDESVSARVTFLPKLDGGIHK